MHLLDDTPDRDSARGPAQRRLYTDGSFRRGQQGAQAGWAFAAVEIDRQADAASPPVPPTQSRLLHAACGRVTTDQGHASYAGATEMSHE